MNIFWLAGNLCETVMNEHFMVNLKPQWDCKYSGLAIEHFLVCLKRLWLEAVRIVNECFLASGKPLFDRNSSNLSETIFV